jgi:hypothetical protein
MQPLIARTMAEKSVPNGADVWINRIEAPGESTVAQI